MVTGNHISSLTFYRFRIKNSDCTRKTMMMEGILLQIILIVAYCAARISVPIFHRNIWHVCLSSVIPSLIQCTPRIRGKFELSIERYVRRTNVIAIQGSDGLC